MPGQRPILATLAPEDTDAYTDAFFHSAFIHGTNERPLRNYRGSYAELWAQAREVGTFPSKRLVPLNRTVEEVVDA